MWIERGGGFSAGVSLWGTFPDGTRFQKLWNKIE